MLIRKNAFEILTNFYISIAIFRMFHGQGDSKQFSDLKQELLDVEDRSQAWCPDIKIYQKLRSNLQVNLTLYKAI